MNVIIKESVIMKLIDAVYAIHNILENENCDLLGMYDDVFNVYDFLSDLYVAYNMNSSDLYFDSVVFSDIATIDKYKLLFCNKLVSGVKDVE